MSAEDAVSERVRFDDNISFIDDSMGGDDQSVNTGGISDNVSLSGRLLKVSKTYLKVIVQGVQYGWDKF